MASPTLIEMPAGRIVGKLTFQIATDSGRIVKRAIPAREWSSAALAIDVGHLWCAQHFFRMYAVELEIVREVARPEAPCTGGVSDADQA